MIYKFYPFLFVRTAEGILLRIKNTWEKKINTKLFINLKFNNNITNTKLFINPKFNNNNIKSQNTNTKLFSNPNFNNNKYQVVKY